MSLDNPPGNPADLATWKAQARAGEAPAPALLQFEIMRRAKARRCLEYDLGDLGGRLGTLGGVTAQQVGPIDIVFSAAAYERSAAQAGG